MYTHVERISYEHHLSIKKFKTNELKKKKGGKSLVGRQGILRLDERIKGDARRFEINSKEMLEETLMENLRKNAGTE